MLSDKQIEILLDGFMDQYRRAHGRVPSLKKAKEMIDWVAQEFVQKILLEETLTGRFVVHWDKEYKEYFCVPKEQQKSGSPVKTARSRK